MAIRFRAGMGLWLAALAMLASLPLFLFAAYLILELGHSRRDAITAQLLQRTEATANAVEQRLSLVLGALNALATSDAARRDDLPALYEHARRIAQSRPDTRAISLIAPDQRMVFLTLRPFGTRGIPASDLDVVARIFATGRPAVSGPFKSPISDRIVTTLGVPVFRDGKVVYCLRMVLSTESLNELLAQQKLPPDWISRIVDRDGRVLARSLAPERSVGKAGNPAVLAALHAGTREVFDLVTQEGIPTRAVLAKVPSWDWHVVVSVPTAALDAPIRRTLMLLAAFGLAVVVVCTFAAYWLARHITRQTRQVVDAAQALHRGGLPGTGPVDILEFDEMAQAMGEVARRERRANLALTHITARHQELATELASARLDALTVLPSRALFRDMAEGLRAVVASHGGGKLALLFIDLDGFKAVNDNHGHDQGDRILVRTADILRAVTRESDVAGRLGGDEFVVCLNADREHIEAIALDVAERIIAAVGEIGFGIGCSIGIAAWPDHCPDLSCAMRRADEAMYEAKRRGKNRLVTFGAEAKADGTPWLAAAPPDCRAECAF